jgi:CPA1 family monovalent cation:H+ antiporter
MFRRTPSNCSHIDSIQYFERPAEIAGCEECLELGMGWVHLRMCQSCGHIGCCDNSEGKHATGHHRESGHPIVRSVEPGEGWSWCYVDEVFFQLNRG